MERRRTPQILLVDDDPMTLLALSETLRLRLGNVVIHAATSADSAIKLLSSTTYNVIVSDVLMPGADGLSVLKEAQRLHPQVPVIVVTGLDVEREEAALYGGAYAFLEKPLTVDRFSSVVCAVQVEPTWSAGSANAIRPAVLNLISALENPSQ